MSENKPTNKALLLTIFITVFIDMLGVSIIIPVIPAIFFEQNSDFFSAAVSHNQKALYYSFLLMCYPLFQFFGAPLLGAISDRYGRKPVLSFTLVGTFIGYLLFAYALYIRSVPLLFISRIIPGFMGGNIAIIMSSIADVSNKENRVNNFGLVGMAFGIGFILGPVIGGVLSDETVVPWFNHTIPFLATASLTLLNFILVRLFFKETLHTRKETKIRIFSGVQNIIKSFKDPNLRSIFSVVLLLSIGFTFYTNFFSTYLYDSFEYSEKDIGLLYGYIGLWLAFTQGFIVRRFSSKYLPTKVVMFSIPLLAIGLALILAPTESWMFFMINPIIAIGQGVTSPNMSSIVSSQVSEDMQGSILGINQSMQSLGQIIPTALGGFLLGVSHTLPLIISSITIVFAFIIFMLNRKKISYN